MLGGRLLLRRSRTLVSANAAQLTSRSLPDGSQPTAERVSVHEGRQHRPGCHCSRCSSKMKQREAHGGACDCGGCESGRVKSLSRQLRMNTHQHGNDCECTGCVFKVKSMGHDHACPCNDCSGTHALAT